MPPPPLPASSGVAGNGMDLDMSTSPVDDGTGNPHHAMMSMGGMTFDGIMGLEGMNNNGLIGMNDMGDMGVGVGMGGGMDMTGMGMDAAMGAMGIGGMSSFGGEAMGMIEMDFGGARQSHGPQGSPHQEQMYLHSSDAVGTKSNEHTMHQQHTMPVATPASMLNLGRVGGGRLGSASGSGLATPGTALGTGVTTRAQKNSKSFSGSINNGATATAPGKSATGTKSRRSNIVSPGLKPLRPGKLSGSLTGRRLG